MQKASPVAIPRPVHGDFTIDTGTITPLGSKTENITLPGSDFKYGWLRGHLFTGSGSSRLKLPIWVFFTTTQNFSNSMAGDIKTYSLYGYLFDNWMMKGLIYGDDGKLSFDHFTGTVAGGSWRSRLKSCYINGSNLELIFYNPGTANSSRAHFRGTYSVFR